MRLAVASRPPASRTRLSSLFKASSGLGRTNGLRQADLPISTRTRWAQISPNLARLEVGRDVDNTDEYERLHQIAKLLTSKSPTSYGRVTTVNSWVSSQLQYQESPVTRSAVEALEDRAGDCGEYTTVMVALLRAMGIPARRAVGRFYDFDTLSAHAWVEVALPKRSGEPHWFVADPTFAWATAIEEEKAAYVQLNDRMLLYPAKPTIKLEGTTAKRISDIFLNRRKTDEERFSDPAEADRFVDLVIAAVEKEISAAHSFSRMEICFFGGNRPRLLEARM